MSTEQAAQLDALISIVFVVYGDHGPKVLFRYPHDVDNRNEDTTTQTGVFHAGVTGSTVLTSRQLLSSLYDSSLESLLIPKQSSGCHKRFQVQVGSLVCVGYPFQPDHTTNKMYNIVFIVEKNTSRPILDSLVNLSMRMSVAFAHEERHCNYITRNLRGMERFYNEEDITARDRVDPHTMEDGDYIIEHCPFEKMVRNNNCLAVTHSKVFDSIKNTLSAKVLINRTINFSFFVDLQAPDDEISLAPFESFVLLDEPNGIKNSLNYDSSPAIIKLLEVPRPYFRNVKDIAIHLDLEYDEIQAAVLALVRWRKALILYPILNTNEYMLSHVVPISQYPYYARQFSQQFKGYDFYTEVSKFSERINLSEILDLFQDKETIDCYKSIVVWFLRRRLLVQLFAHVYLRPPQKLGFELRKPSRDSIPIASAGIVRECEELSSSLYASLTRGISITEHNRQRIFCNYLTRSQIKCIKDMSVETSMLNDFAKVLPHAHAGRSVEDILWRTNMVRSDLHDITETFNKYLITIKHPS